MNAYIHYVTSVSLGNQSYVSNDTACKEHGAQQKSRHTKPCNIVLRWNKQCLELISWPVCSHWHILHSDQQVCSGASTSIGRRNGQGSNDNLFRAAFGEKTDKKPRGSVCVGKAVCKDEVCFHQLWMEKEKGCGRLDKFLVGFAKWMFV